MILLPIKPKYAFAIMNKEKKVEFRKANFKNRDSEICIVYASSPYKKLIGYFMIKNILEEDTKFIWKKYSEIGWVKKEDLDSYYLWKDKGFVIEIADFIPFSSHISPKEILKDFKAPQSFKYLNEKERELFYYNLIT